VKAQTWMLCIITQDESSEEFKEAIDL